MLWILKPVKPWREKYDRSFGFVIRAETEAKARAFAASQSQDDHEGVWLDPNLTTCKELSPDGEVGIVLQDFRAG